MMKLKANDTLGKTTWVYVRSWKVVVPVMIVLTTYSLVATYLLYNHTSLNGTQFGISVTPIAGLFNRHAGLKSEQAKLIREQIQTLLPKTGDGNEKNISSKEVKYNRHSTAIRKDNQAVITDKQFQELRNAKQVVITDKQFQDKRSDKQAVRTDNPFKELRKDNQAARTDKPFQELRKDNQAARTDKPFQELRKAKQAIRTDRQFQELRNDKQAVRTDKQFQELRNDKQAVRNDKQFQELRNDKQAVGTDKQFQELRNDKQLTNVGNDKQLQKDRNDKQLQNVRNDNNLIGVKYQYDKQLKEVKTHNQLTVVGNGTFYIFTIHAHQTKQGSKWDKLFVTGWELRSAMLQKYICCLKYENGTLGKAFSAYKHSWNKGIPLKARLVVCTSASSAIEAMPKWATLVLNSESCEKKTKFHKVIYRLPETTPSVAICGKIAYAKKDPRYLVEWVEYHKYLGASKIVIYPYSDLHEPARKVLEYYVKEGIMETVEMPTVPLLDIYPRHFSVQNSTIMWQDEKVPLFDVEQRLRPYQYYGVIDTDEFIVPKQTGVKNLLQLMEHLLRKYPDGGTFKMMSAIHILNLDKTNQTSDLMIEQFGHHTGYINNTGKLLHVTDRIQEGSIWIHFAETKPGYKMVFPSPRDDVAYKHFRKCPNKWLTQFKEFKQYRDGRMEIIARVIGPRIRHVISILGI